MSKRDMPHPIYAAAGAGDLAYQKLRQLPELTERVLRGASQGAHQLRQRAADVGRIDLPRVRESAQRHTDAVVARATAGYRNLVERGERVVAERTSADPPTAESPAEIPVASADPDQ